MIEATGSDLAVATGTHIGLVHHTNEDSFVTFDTLEGGRVLCVCDGMGGMGRGDEASRIAVDVIKSETLANRGFPPDRMRAAVIAADIRIRDKLAVPGNTPGSTSVMVYVENALAHVCWVGDSRAYLVRDGVVVDRTRDHKLVTELVDAGELTEEEAKHSSLAHVVTRALGGRGVHEPAVQPDVLRAPWKLHKGDVVVLCSDGLCDLVDDRELPSHLGLHDEVGAVARLTQLALDRGGHDNITIIVATYNGPDFNEDNSLTPVMNDGLRVLPPLPAHSMRSADDTWAPDEGEPEVFADDTSTPVELPATDPVPPLRLPEPEEEPQTAIAVGIALVAALLIVLAVLFAQGVFSGSSATVEVESK